MIEIGNDLVFRHVAELCSVGQRLTLSIMNDKILLYVYICEVLNKLRKVNFFSDAIVCPG